MVRTAEAARRIRERKLNRRGLPMASRAWQKLRRCELCGEPYCANNYPDHKTRVYRWFGFEVCAYCRFKIIPTINRLTGLDVLKVSKKYRKKKG